MNGTVSLGQIYGGPSAPFTGTSMGVTPGGAVQAGPAAPASASPAIAWVGIILALLAIRIAYEMGAKVD